jgi:hypothetical protein
MRELSEHGLREAAGLPGDAQRLARWSSPTGRRSWMIPLNKIAAVAEMLGATKDDADELMALRLADLEGHDPHDPAVVSARWALSLRADSLTQDERHVLSVYRRVSSNYPHGLSGSSVEDSVLEDGFHSLLVRHHDETESALRADDLPADTKAALRRLESLTSKATRTVKVRRGERRRTIRKLMLALRRGSAGASNE